jgi:hypothetical protein
LSLCIDMESQKQRAYWCENEYQHALNSVPASLGL